MRLGPHRLLVIRLAALVQAFHHLLVLGELVDGDALAVLAFDFFWVWHRVEENLLELLDEESLLFLLFILFNLRWLPVSHLVQLGSLLLHHDDLLPLASRLHVWIVRISCHIFHYLLEIPTIDLNLVRIVRACACQFLSVGVQVVIHECHLDPFWIGLKRFKFVRIDLATYLVKHVVAFLGEARDLVFVRQCV